MEEVIDEETSASTRRVTRTAEQLSNLRREMREAFGSGFRTKADVLESLSDEAPPRLSHEQVVEVVDEVFSSLKAERASQPGQGDYEKLAAAFRGMEAAGLTARMNFTCCNSCGRSEILGERKEGDWGFAFFHGQDADGLDGADSYLWLKFGSFTRPTTKSIVGVGEKVVQVLRQHGLPCEWDGSPHQCISVGPMDWRKRLDEDDQEPEVEPSLEAPSNTRKRARVELTKAPPRASRARKVAL